VGIRALKDFVRRHWLVVMVVLVITAVVGYEVKRTPPVYFESTTVSFILPQPLDNLNSEASVSPSLITSGAVIAQIMMSPESQRLVQDAGGTADFNLTLNNSNDEQYPEYNYPLATLTIQSTSLTAVQQTFAVTVRQLKQLVLEQQIQAGVPPRSRVSVRVLGEPSPIMKQGSKARSLGGLALLAVISVSMISILLDRHRNRLVLILTRSRRWLPMPAVSSSDPQGSIQTSSDPGQARTTKQTSRHRASRNP
jgi:hypothetical protein